MKKLEYIKILLESSFKEANLFWIRNAAFSIIQLFLIGLFLNAINTFVDNCYLKFIIVLGLFIGLIHLRIVWLSKRYNHLWFEEVRKYVKTHNSKKGDIPPELNTLLQNYFKKNNNGKCLNWFHQASIFGLCIPFLFTLFWIGAFYEKIF